MIDDNEGLQMKYFVLKPRGNDEYAKAAREALKTYAGVIALENPELSNDLMEWVNDEVVKLGEQNETI